RECSRAVAETMQTLPTTRALLRPAVRARRDGAPHRERWPVWRRDRRNGSAINGGSSAATRGPTWLASYRRTAGEVNAPDRCTVPPRATRLVAKVPAEVRGMATALNVPGLIGEAPFLAEFRAGTGECGAHCSPRTNRSSTARSCVRGPGRGPPQGAAV